MEKKNNLLFKQFKEGVKVETTVNMTVEDVGDDYPLGTIGVVMAEPNDEEQLVMVSIKGSINYLPKDVLAVVD